MPATAPAGAEPFLRLVGIRKSYPGVLALQGFDLTVSPGEVIGIVGENGAGKSTLMKILGGVVPPDHGDIIIDGASHASLSVAQSLAAGIAFVHQELNLFDNLDVAANIFIGREARTGGLLNLVDRDTLRRQTEPLLRRVGASFTPDTLVSTLSLAQQQMVEIAKALSMNARLVILDEPTSSLPTAETEKLLAVIAGLKAEGISVIFISHRLGEVERAADRVLVLRDGALVGTLGKTQITHDGMVKLMIGRELKARETIAREVGTAGDIVLTARGIRTLTYPGRTVDLDLRRGEILGIAGLVGSGRTELARVLFGVDRPLGGMLTLGGKPLALRSAGDAVADGIFLVPEDRKGESILLDLPIAQNVSLPNLGAYASNLLVSAGAEIKAAEKQKTALAIKTPTVQTRTGSLSGGNQQKVVLAKWLTMSPRVMIFDEPTRGIDIGAKSEIYRLIRSLADSGVAVLMISSEMEEVISVSDRIAVMHEGAISGVLAHEQFSQENILLLAVGKKLASAATAH